MISSLQLVAFASENNVRIEEMELSLSVPNSYTIINDNTPANDSVFEKIGVTKSELLTQFKEKNIYLNCISQNNNEEIVVTMTPNSISDFNLLSDTSLKALASALVDQYKTYNISVSKYEVYQQSQAKFIKVYFQDLTQSAYGLQYYTIFDQKAMNFTLRSYDGNISTSQENTIQSIVDSIQFDGEAQKQNEGADTSSFVYEDNTSGINFTVPNNWEKTPLSKDRQYIDVKFSSTKEDGLSILFGATDLWNQLPSSDKAGMTRAELNDSQLSAADIAEMLNLEPGKVSEKKFNNIHFYITEVTSSSEVYGLNLTATMTHAIHIQNGWIYWFQFAGTHDSSYFGDFEKMLNSVYINGEEKNVTSIVGTLENNNDSTVSNNSTSVLLLAFVVVIAVIVIVVVLYRKRKAKCTTTLNASSINDSKETNNLNCTCSDNNGYIFCHKCGNKLPADSEFCYRCGTRQVKE